MKIFFTRARDWYARYERPVSSASLIGGFVFDAVTLHRVDLFWENLWVLAHLVIVAVCIVLINRQENEAMESYDPSHAHFWYINVLQFFFGGLLSTYLVFYFRSATLSVAWPFLLLLAAAFIANESLKRHYARLVFQISLFFLSLLAFSVYIVPVLFHRIGTDIFLLSGAASLLVLWLFLRGLKFFVEPRQFHNGAEPSEALRRRAKERFSLSRKALMFSIAGIFLATHILYFLNLIPPIPLSLKDGGIYHSLVRGAPGTYVVKSEETGWLDYFSLHETFHSSPGNTAAYAYSAIFSPASFDTDIVHEWQKYDSTAGKWITASRVALSVLGGREGGYRTYSYINNVAPGKWRVDVKTAGGQVIGRLRFNVIRADTAPVLETIVKD